MTIDTKLKIERSDNWDIILKIQSPVPAWDIAADCSTRADARELAQCLIPVSERDPLWSNAAAAIRDGVQK